MDTITIDPFAEYTKEQLIVLLKAETVRHENQAERVRNLENENRRQYADFQATIQRLQSPSIHWADADKIMYFLIELVGTVRPLLGVEHIKYGVRNLCYGMNPEGTKKVEIAPPVRNVARIVRDIQDYFDWDDE